jgi:hypothetical protein
MWRTTERASLEKKPSIRLSQEPCFTRGAPRSADILILSPKKVVNGWSAIRSHAITLAQRRAGVWRHSYGTRRPRLMG